MANFCAALQQLPAALSCRAGTATTHATAAPAMTLARALSETKDSAIAARLTAPACLPPRCPAFVHVRAHTGCLCRCGRHRQRSWSTLARMMAVMQWRLRCLATGCSPLSHRLAKRRRSATTNQPAALLQPITQPIERSLRCFGPDSNCAASGGRRIERDAACGGRIGRCRREHILGRGWRQRRWRRRPWRGRK